MFFISVECHSVPNFRTSVVTQPNGANNENSKELSKPESKMGASRLMEEKHFGVVKISCSTSPQIKFSEGI